MVENMWAKDFFMDKNPTSTEEDSELLEHLVHAKERHSFSFMAHQSRSALQEKIIRILSSKNEGFTVSFAGMKRLLGDVHQQKLAKSIQRLVDARILQKNDEGYQLSREFYQMGTSSPLLNSRSRVDVLSKRKPHRDEWRASSLTKGSFGLSKELDPRHVHEQFKGRWFGRFRYVGGTVSEDWTSAEWISDDLYSYLQLFVKPREIRYQITNPRTGDEASLKTFLLKTVGKPLSVDLSPISDDNNNHN